MPISQSFKPPFSPTDVDTMQLDFAPTMGPGEILSAPQVSAGPVGGFTFGTPQIGIVAPDGTFSASGSGSVVQVLATAASTTGSFQVTFQVSTSSGRTLHRTVRCDIAARS